MIAFLIAFNGRRPTEVTYATTANFETVKTQVTTKEDKISVLYVTATKNDIRVPIILPNSTHKVIVLLENMRKQLDIKGEIAVS